MSRSLPVSFQSRYVMPMCSPHRRPTFGRRTIAGFHVLFTCEKTSILSPGFNALRQASVTTAGVGVGVDSIRASGLNADDELVEVEIAAAARTAAGPGDTLFVCVANTGGVGAALNTFLSSCFKLTFHVHGTSVDSLAGAGRKAHKLPVSPPDDLVPLTRTDSRSGIDLRAGAFDKAPVVQLEVQVPAGIFVLSIHAPLCSQTVGRIVCCSHALDFTKRSIFVDSIAGASSNFAMAGGSTVLSSNFAPVCSLEVCGSVEIRGSALTNSVNVRALGLVSGAASSAGPGHGPGETETETPYFSHSSAQSHFSMLFASILSRAPSSWAHTFIRDISNCAFVMFQSKLFDEEDSSDGASG